MKIAWGASALLGLALALPGGAAVQDDDLAVVKRAVKQEVAPAGGGSDKGAREEKPRVSERSRAGKAQWLRVRVVEKNGRKKVSVNLPLALVRALGDDFDLGWLCDRHGSRHRVADRRDRCPEIRLSDVLAALDSGEDLVQVDEEDASVRIWVE